MKNIYMFLRKFRTDALLLMAVMFFAVMGVHAQAYFTSGSNDDSRLNQFLVSHTGVGSLQPATWYNTMHKSYQSDAAETNKLFFAGGMKAILMQEEPVAQSIDSALVQRAREEAKRVADRKLDVAWAIDGTKIDNRLAHYKTYIMKIVDFGGTLDDYQRYMDDYNRLTCGISAVQDAYLDNSLRSREYSAMYEDVLSSELRLIDFLKKLVIRKKCKEDFEKAQEYAGRPSYRDRVDSCVSRWQNAFILGSSR